jgi:hypothetical protein
MYSKGIVTYSEFPSAKHIMFGLATVAGISTVDYTVPTLNIDIHQVRKAEEIADDDESNSHRLRLAETSLSEEWGTENDKHWESFL